MFIRTDSSIGRIQDYGSYDEGSTPSRCTKNTINTEPNLGWVLLFIENIKCKYEIT